MNGDDTNSKRGNAFVQFYRWVFGIGHERNIGGLERTVRYTLGSLFTLGGFVVFVFPILSDTISNAVLALVLIVCGLYGIYEAQVQYCPLNHTFDRSTYSES